MQIVTDADRAIKLIQNARQIWPNLGSAGVSDLSVSVNVKQYPITVIIFFDFDLVFLRVLPRHLRLRDADSADVGMETDVGNSSMSSCCLFSL